MINPRNNLGTAYQVHHVTNEFMPRVIIIIIIKNKKLKTHNHFLIIVIR